MSAYKKQADGVRIARIAVVFAFLWVLATVFATANAENWNTSRGHYVGQWGSLLLTLGSSEVARAFTASGPDLFAVNFTKGKCDKPSIEILDTASKYFGKTLSAALGAYFRVDSGPIYNGLMIGSAKKGDDTLFLEGWVAHDKQDELIAEMEGGQTLRIKLTRKGMSPIYEHFSLSGSQAAIDRAHRICSGLRSDRQYFPSGS